MKIAVIGSKGIPARYGGTQVAVENIYIRLIDKSWSVTIYSRHYYSDIKQKKFYYQGVEVLNIKGIKTKRLDTLSHSLISTIHASKRDFDIIVFHGFIPAIFAFIPKIFGKKTVMHSHGISFLVSEKLIKKWSFFDRVILNLTRYFTARFIDVVTSVSISELNLVKILYKKPEIHYIPNGLNFDVPSETHRIDLPDLYFLFVGRILEGKGIDILLDAFNLLNIKYKNFKLLLIGNNCTTIRHYNRLLEYSKTNPNIVFLGSKYGDELITFYKQAYAVIIPSLYESFSLVLFEALYYNGKLICSDIEQFKMTVNNFVSYFKTGSSQDLADRMQELIDDNNKLQNLFENSRQFNFESYSWNKIAELYHNLYLNTLNSK